MAIFTTSGNSKCAVDGHEYPPKPAGDSHHHTDEDTSALWDRLRADLNNLGAAYGPLETPQGPLTPFGEALQSLSHGLAGAATNQRRGSEPVDNLSPTDRNAYFDGIILAARKKREAEESWNNIDPVAIDGGPICTYHERETQRRYVAKAMSRPLDWEPRVGHKGVEIE